MSVDSPAGSYEARMNQLLSTMNPPSAAPPPLQPGVNIPLSAPVPFAQSSQSGAPRYLVPSFLPPVQPGQQVIHDGFYQVAKTGGIPMVPPNLISPPQIVVYPNDGFRSNHNYNNIGNGVLVPKSLLYIIFLFLGIIIGSGLAYIFYRRKKPKQQ